MDDVREIVAGLTKAQHTALWNMGISKPSEEFANGWRLAPHDGWRRAGQACSSLVTKGLADKLIGDQGIMYRLTPLGLRVRVSLVGERG